MTRRPRRPMVAATKLEAAPVRRVRPEVYQTALRLAGGDRSRLEVVGDDEVLVRNRSSRDRW